jgi:pyruvate,orthophosphate dikinase
MGDFYHYNSHPRGAEGLVVYCDLYAKAAREAIPEALRSDASRLWLIYLHKVVTESGERLAGNLIAVDRSLQQIEAIVTSPPLAASSSAGLKRLVAALGSHQGGRVAVTKDRAAELLRSVLDHVYGMWLDREDPAVWFRELRPLPSDHAALPAAVDAISHSRLERSRAGLTTGRDRRGRVPAADLLALPDHVAIMRAYLDAADALEGAIDERTRWLCRVIGEELLSPVHDRALRSLARSCRTLVTHADHNQFAGFVRDVFGTLRSNGIGNSAATLDLVRRLGTAVLDGAPSDWAALVTNEILTLDFHRPDFAGFTADWAVRVNPNHLKNIRAFLSIIATRPAAAQQLLAALVIHLEIGGVFVADTDLFQKDVSQLLSADIGPVYQEVRHLLRRLPVYFSDIGAEGALREVSTRIDEIGDRRDPICHFLRKQCHVESNPALISVVEEVARFWATGDSEPLRRYLPDESHEHVVIDGEYFSGLHRVFSRLAASEPGLDGLFSAPVEDVDRVLGMLADEDPIDLEKARLLFRLRYELARKYALEHTDVLERLRAVTRLDSGLISRLEADLREHRYEAALETLLALLEELQGIVLSSDPTDAFEDIYHKRHIGTGIPSMYGRYREDRLEAIGLSFRIESLAGALFDRIVADGPVGSLDAEALQRVARWLRLLTRGLRIEGLRSQALAMSLSMLDDALALPAVTREELVDIFRGISQSVQRIVRSSILDVYGDRFETLGPKMVLRGELEVRDATEEEAIIGACEGFLRDLIAESMALQRIDHLAAMTLHALTDPTREWIGAAVGAPAAAVDVIPIFNGAGRHGPLHLGNKGFMLARLADYGFPIPHGFILPTGLSRMRMAGDAGQPVPGSVVDRVRAQLGVLERRAEARFGESSNPLLLSVRAGAPISMPGMLDSFLNVGINFEIAEGLASSCGSPWAAWDAYRRFLQFWGMSHGLDRDLFDALMSDAKLQFSVPKKALLPPGRMRDLATEYRTLVADHGVKVIDEPFAQLLRCIELVFDSWDSGMARVYRGAMMIGDGWGTAAIVQNMVYGNLNARSGTGVLLTHHPQRDPNAFELFGDCVIQGQGDDVVSGLVETFPISHLQRSPESPDAGVSLEHDFPAIYAELHRLGRLLVDEHGWAHQEIEFTFESERTQDLHILQAREAVTDVSVAVPTFVPGADLYRSRLAVGIGVGGGALSGRVAQDELDIIRLRYEHPEDPVLLVRPDTVPDDLHLVLQADALLTAIGGATSHAAVVAKRMGKTCVVGCRELRVYEANRRIEIAGHSLAGGDRLSISGADGSVYLGQHDVEVRESPGRAVVRIGAGT